MSTTVLDALINAQTNLITIGEMGLKDNPIFFIAMEQLNNGIVSLENGLDVNEVIQENAFSEVDTGT